MKRLFFPFLLLILLAAACAPGAASPTVAPPTQAPPSSAPATNTAAPSAVPATAVPTTAPATVTAAPTAAAATDTVAAPTAAPTTAPVTGTPADQPLRVVVRASDDSVHIVGTGLSAAGVNFSPGLLPMGGAAGGAAYVLDFQGQPKAQKVDGSGNVSDLSFIDKPDYGLAVWPGDGSAQPRLAWATSPTGADSPTQLFIANADGSDLRAVISETIASDAAPYQLVAERWSADGQSLYFSREPYGIGGYIPFAGASSLYRYRLADGSVTELLPFQQGGGMVCLDDLTPDAGMTVGHCVQPNTIDVHNFGGGKDGLIAAPSAVTDFRLAGGARFSPDGQQVAFALAKGDPTGEQGWLALSDSLDGQSHLLATADPGNYYTVVAWLNNDTLLVQLNTLSCTAACNNSLWTVGQDGANLTKLADGTFLTLL